MRPEDLRPASPSLPPPGPRALPSSLGAHAGCSLLSPAPKPGPSLPLRVEHS